ncbi:MAG: replicative DNA helicase [Campylobacterota bacterium]|nr:replicative DNA helicase [Campylobacterota bacterium]
MDNIYSLNIERAVLSSILFDQDLIEDILGVLKPKDFYLPAHQKVFEVMRILNSADMPIDEEFIKKRVDNKEVSDSVLIEILSANPISNTMAYVKEIKDGAVKRELATLSTNIKKLTIEDDITALEAVDKIQNELYSITMDSASSDLKDMTVIIENTRAHIKKMQEKGTGHLTGQTTGFYALDKKTTGFNPGDLVIIAARPAMGKTSIVLNTTLQNLEKGDGVIFFSLEMPETQLMIRLLSAKTGIPLQNVRKGELDPTQANKLEEAFQQLSNKKLFVDDNGNVNINQLRARARKIAQNKDNNIKMIIIDYLQLMQGTGGQDRRLTVDEISRGLKLLAREMEVPIVALSQLNRGLESRPDKRPMLSDIRESGAIEQDADIIMFVYRDDIYKERDEQRKEKEAADKGETYKSAFIDKPIEEAEIIIGKQRNGSTGTIKLDFHKELTKFVDKEEPFGAAPVITTFESVGDPQVPTNIDIPDMDGYPDTNIDMPDIF